MNNLNEEFRFSFIQGLAFFLFCTLLVIFSLDLVENYIRPLLSYVRF